MKRIITIFLLLLCVAYILPVCAIVKNEIAYSIVDIEDEKEDNNKKEKKVELIIVENTLSYISALCNTRFENIPCTLSPLFHTVETPPPNFI